MQKPPDATFTFSWFLLTGSSRKQSPAHTPEERGRTRLVLGPYTGPMPTAPARRNGGHADFVDTQPDWRNHD